ncbi:LytR/AlgR family response regulator transcription factor [Ammoniphilus resinae]|uniref:Two-component system response regulator LytT n=1 Tax=Ammoniphilus resinae TaxID=861532 RepID=A0ABS4GPG3_9BACL|nr:LytTR family DNA-binding domain-containing protein [Ammoniphilus resinae]MBP1932116.1 two-component system response regulator LytT [Ammoniphilus resinae]
MIRVYLVEDEPFARDELKYLLSRVNPVQIIGEAEDMEEAFAEIQQLEPDILFLDIHLAEGTGLDLAVKVGELEKPPFIVFATAYDEYALQAFELNAVDYITKPFSEERIRQTIEKVKQWLEVRPKEVGNKAVSEKSKSKLAISIDGRIILLDIGKIAYIGTENRQVIIKTLDHSYTVDIPLYELTRKFEDYSFLRVHRGFIVNTEYITEVEPWFNGAYQLILQDGSKIPVSRSYVKEVRDFFGF